MSLTFDELRQAEEFIGGANLDQRVTIIERTYPGRFLHAYSSTIAGTGTITRPGSYLVFNTTGDPITVTVPDAAGMVGQDIFVSYISSSSTPLLLDADGGMIDGQPSRYLLPASVIGLKAIRLPDDLGGGAMWIAGHRGGYEFDLPAWFQPTTGDYAGSVGDILSLVDIGGGLFAPGWSSNHAMDVGYNNTASGLTATTVQEAIDEIVDTGWSNFTINGIYQPGAISSISVAYARYRVDPVADVCFFEFSVTATSGGSAGDQIIIGTTGLPTGTTNRRATGTFDYFDTGSTIYTGSLSRTADDALRMQVSGNGSYLGQHPNIGVASGDVIAGGGWFRVAS